MYSFVVTIMRAIGHLLTWIVVAGRMLLAMFLMLPAGWVLIPFALWNFRRWERDRVVEVLGCMEQAILLNLPMAVLIDASAEAWGYETRQASHKLVARLHAGESAGEAALAVMKSVPARWRALLEVGNQRGQLLQAIRRILDEHRRFAQVDTGRSGVLLYFVLLGGMFMLMLTTIGAFVLPTLNNMVEDFGVARPVALNVFIETRAMLLSPLFWLIVFAAAFLIGTAALVENGKFMLRSMMAAGWYLPGVASMVKARALSDVLINLADAASAGLPLTQAVRNSRQLILPMPLSRRLRRWADAMEAGQSPADAAAAAHLPAMLVTLLRFTTSHAELAQGLDFLASHFDWVARRRLGAIEKALLTLIFLMMAAGVCITALAVFSFITTIMWAVIHDSGVF